MEKFKKNSKEYSVAELNELNKKIKYELNEAKTDSDDEKNNESEDADSTKGGSLGVRRSTAQQVLGRVSKDFDWQINYNILRKAICEDVLTVDLEKTKKLFKIVKDYINDKEKFESKYEKK